MADGYVLKSSVLNAIHNGDIDMGMVTPHEYRLLEDLSERIDRRIQRVPAADVVPVVRCKNCVFYQKDPEIAKAMNLEPEIYCAVNCTEMGPDAFCSYGRTTPWIEAPAKEVDNG